MMMGTEKKKYKVRFTYEIDGTTYDDFKTCYKKMKKGGYCADYGLPELKRTI